MEQIVNRERVALFTHQLNNTGGAYLVYHTNNESYDDYKECNIGITFSEEIAEEAVRKLSLVEDMYSELYPYEMSYEQKRESRYDVMSKVLEELGVSSFTDVNALLNNNSGRFEYVKLPILI